MIAVFCPVHTQVDLAYDQLLNYNSQFSGKARFFLHLSEEARDKRITEYRLLKRLFENVEIVDKSYKTSGRCVFGAFLACSEYLFRNYSSSEFAYIYLHTDADLVLSNGIYKYISENNVGFGISSKPLPEKEKDGWGPAVSMHNDSVFWSVIKSAGGDPSRMWRGRQEGAFFSFELWEDIFEMAKGFFPWNEYFSKVEREWPVEEVFIPTMCRDVLGVTENVRNVIHAKPVKLPGGRKNPENLITEADLDFFLKGGNSDVFGAKRWPLQVNHEIRRIVREKVLGKEYSVIKLPW